MVRPKKMCHMRSVTIYSISYKFESAAKKKNL